MLQLCQNLSRSKWDCKYHVVFVPKRRRKVLFGKTRRQLEEVFHALAPQKECQILEGHLMPDHGYMCIAIRPEAPGGFGDRVPEKEERHRDCPALWQRAKFHGRAFLGSKACRVHGRVRAGASPPIHPRTRRGGWIGGKLLIRSTKARLARRLN